MPHPERLADPALGSEPAAGFFTPSSPEPAPAA